MNRAVLVLTLGAMALVAVVAAPRPAVAQCNPPVKATIKFGTVPADVTFSPLPAPTPIPITIQVQNCNGAPVLTTDGFASTDFFRRLYFTDPNGGTVIDKTEEQLHFNTNKLNNFFCLSRNGVLLSPSIPVVPVQQLNGPPTPFFREYQIKDARALYDLTLPGHYSVTAKFDLLTFDAAAKFTDCDQLKGTTVVPVSATAGQRFTVVSNTLELIIAGAGETNSTITGTGPVLADGVATSTVTITLKDTNNNPLAGVVPTFSATGSNNTIGACSVVNASGVSTCSLQSTTAEVKTLSIVTPVNDVGGTVTFTEPGAVATRVWVGLANSDDVGIRFDLQAIVKKNGGAVGSGQLASVFGGSSGFNNAALYAIALAPASVSIPVSSGDTLSIEVLVRNACSGSGKNSGTARLWFNGAYVDTGATRDAATRLEPITGGASSVYFLRTPAALSAVAGSTRTSVDKAVGAKCGPYQSFGTWSITLP